MGYERSGEPTELLVNVSFLRFVPGMVFGTLTIAGGGVDEKCGGVAPAGIACADPHHGRRSECALMLITAESKVAPFAVELVDGNGGGMPVPRLERVRKLI